MKSFLRTHAFVLTLTSLFTLTASAQTPDYPNIFKKAREIYLGQPERLQKRYAKVNESSVVEILQNDPSKMSLSREALLAEVAKESSSFSDPTKHLRLVPPKGQPGYSELTFNADHDYFVDGKTVLKSNLVKVWGDFLKRAKRRIILNVFDFDLVEIAQILVKKAGQGVKVQVGIDKNVIADRPEVKAIYDMLIAGGVQVMPVSSVSLNHQKMAAIDWDQDLDARVLFSSGNLTQSCLGAEGDLKAIPAAKRPAESVPNANHVITLKSWLLATLVQHELTKTVDPSFALRGSRYPTVGAYQVTGPGVDPNTLEAYPEHSLIITFAPGGGYRGINQNLIAHFIRKSSGPIRMVQFAYSSEAVSKALLDRAVHDYQMNGSFDFKSVGDTPFAMQFWSQFLKMSGLELLKDPNNKKIKKYIEDPKNIWNQELGTNINDLRSKVFVAPPEYKMGSAKVDGVSYDVSAKIHHKVISMDPYAIVGTSFNFSDAAQDNNEQILVFVEPSLVKAANGMVEWLISKSPGTVYNEAMRRNRLGIQEAAISDNSSETKKPKKP